MDLHVSDPLSALDETATLLGAAPPPAAATDAPRAAGPPPKAESAAVRAKRRRRARGRRFDLPAWAVSLLVHVVILSLLGAATFSREVHTAVASINSALVSTKGAPDELIKIDAPPSDAPRDRALGDLEGTAGPASGVGGGIGTGPPSATPRVGVASAIGEKTSLPSVQVVPHVSGLSDLPAAASIDLGGGGMLSGDVAYETNDVGVALDQLAREILRHLAQHKLTVVWLFDESGSMKDDQRAIKQKFDRVASELKINLETGSGKNKRSSDALNHAVVGFGKGLHYELEKPTFDIDEIGRAIDHLRIDDTGIENTMGAIQEVIGHYASLIRKDRRLLLVLVTDESGDDGGKIEETRQAAVSRGVPIYVIGRQSLFGYERAHLLYVDPVTKDHYWPAIRRGPETADVEMLQWDGLHERWDEQPSGFAPYELARLAKDTGGIYFLLPSKENLRLHTKEKAYSITTLREYLPDYESRVNYFENRNLSEFRRTLHEIIVDQALPIPAPLRDRSRR
ncbi:MAG: vWA domain-containing protein [Singulisphaera sp.]